MRKKAFLTIALLLTVIATSSPLLAQGRHNRVLVEQVVNSPRDPSSGVVSPRDPASGLPTGIQTNEVKAPRDANSGYVSG
ncbi:MAG: hypothetical protein ABI700_12070 [Chloroflexota bacterium]